MQTPERRHYQAHGVELHGKNGDVRLSLQDAFGAFMPRDHACIDPSASIVVKIVDT